MSDHKQNITHTKNKLSASNYNIILSLFTTTTTKKIIIKTKSNAQLTYCVPVCIRVCVYFVYVRYLRNEKKTLILKIYKHISMFKIKETQRALNILTNIFYFHF